MTTTQELAERIQRAAEQVARHLIAEGVDPEVAMKAAAEAAINKAAALRIGR